MQNKICGINNQNQPRLIQFLIYDHDPHEGKILLRIKAIYLKKLILLDCTPISFPPAVLRYLITNAFVVFLIRHFKANSLLLHETEYD